MGIGWTEILLILGVALVVLGPTRLPSLARTLGRAVREFRSSFAALEDDLEGRNAPTDPAKKADGRGSDESGSD
ncbi:MAG TPA: twin-arginine translocase TatA/TatE family subunit [Myxococcota bacterium]|nr:twin-arginine translocase TatA/TatE family subunit [Myxococcota bacterium]HOA14231.1 twin-arginine translocase TatA/TatE family subunit [Myxococcota bacterium]HOH77483.1 twin-arginine translocase TatA/TatE family subunit [Myxococcota bacterium]HPV05034.1 twin-arginine translocase TatA/TatE family subunit [Myxococcota bacterium]